MLDLSWFIEEASVFDDMFPEGRITLRTHQRVRRDLFTTVAGLALVSVA